MRSSGWIYGLGCRLHKEGVLLRGDNIANRIQRRGALSISLTMGVRGLRITCSSSSTISASVTSSSSCSWEISSSWWASSSCILQSSMRFSYLIMDLSIMVREVCRELNLCSISRLDGASATICMALDMASNLLRNWVHRLLHFHKEEAALVHLLLMCLRFSLRTWVTTSSNCSSQAVPRPRK